MAGVLYIVATPIGNLQDLTFRAVEVLRGVDCIFCEDTRVTGVLLKRYDISSKLYSCNAHMEKGRVSQIIDLLSQDLSVAYVSDAGTPGVSDPGNLIVQEIARAEYQVVPIPGASALSTFLSVCGFDLSQGFSFVGFFPRKSGKLLQSISSHQRVVVGYESPYRIHKLLSVISTEKPYAQVCIGRELTKHYEEIIRYKEATSIDPSSVKAKGEFVVGIWNYLKGS